jgi:hypothetical protein
MSATADSIVRWRPASSQASQPPLAMLLRVGSGPSTVFRARAPSSSSFVVCGLAPRLRASSEMSVLHRDPTATTFRPPILWVNRWGKKKNPEPQHPPDGVRRVRFVWVNGLRFARSRRKCDVPAIATPSAMPLKAPTLEVPPTSRPVLRPRTPNLSAQRVLPREKLPRSVDAIRPLRRSAFFETSRPTRPRQKSRPMRHYLHRRRRALPLFVLEEGEVLSRHSTRTSSSSVQATCAGFQSRHSTKRHHLLVNRSGKPVSAISKSSQPGTK